MGDYPHEAFEDKTALAFARTPNMDRLALEGRGGLVRTVPKGMIPSSDVANLALLGYNPKKYFPGRGPLEAISMGVSLKDDEYAFRCNLVTVWNGEMVDYSAGHIRTEESRVVIEHLNAAFKDRGIRFYPGVSYRHLMVVNASLLGDDPKKITCVPPHDILGQPVEDYLPKGPGGKFLTDIMEESNIILKNHEINTIRIDLGENPSNMIWLWGQGKNPELPSFKQRYGLTGSIISAVDLIKGIAKAVGLASPNVPGATGYYDTNYLNKARYALGALDAHDFVFIHVEAADEAGHNGDRAEKIKAIEQFDEKIVGTVMEGLKKYPNKRVLLAPDHATPLELRTHTSDPVPFVLWGDGFEADEMDSFSEDSGKQGFYKNTKGHELMNLLLEKEHR
ncbi:MAG: cofactor-independent phosphoglycerate mutase [Candidatus Theseobacter exili]|nr:cofactor-independent phosphoglycerate mutase [Candidatus Theseobacter exili]